MASRWRALLQERLDEATAILASLLGVSGLVVGGSIGRDEPWPLSDIDLLPIRAPDAADAIAREQARLVDWWAASGRAQTLDVGWLAFTPEEVRQAVAAGVAGAVERMADRRWFHGIDKAYGGYGAHDRDALAGAFATWATAMRFEPRVIEARVAEWERQTLDAHAQAQAAAQSGDPVTATLRLREAARALRLVLLERWGERLGSMGHEWTRWQRIAERHGATDTAASIAFVAAAEPDRARETIKQAPLWLLERIERAYAARLGSGEAVTEAESARDQIAAFRVHVSRHGPDLGGPWLGLPDPKLRIKLAELGRLIGETCPSIRELPDRSSG